MQNGWLIGLLVSLLLCAEPALAAVPICKDARGRTLIGESLCAAQQPNTSRNEQGEKAVGEPRTHAIPFLRGKRRGVYWVRTVVNGRLATEFVIDTGASILQISKEMYDKLVALGTVGNKERLGSATTVIADGSRRRNRVVLLKRIQIGDFTVVDIPAVVGGKGVPPLLGTPILEKLGKWRIDTEKMALIITGTPGKTAKISSSGNDKLSQRCAMMYNNLQQRFYQLQRVVRKQNKESRILEKAFSSLREKERKLFKEKSRSNPRSNRQILSMNKKGKKLAKEQGAYLEMEKRYEQRTKARKKSIKKQVSGTKQQLRVYNKSCPGVLYQNRYGEWSLFKAMKVPKLSSNSGI